LVGRVIARIEGGDPHSPVCFIGPQGLGKTFLMRNIVSELRERRWLCGYSEAGADIGSAINDVLADARQLTPGRGLIRRASSLIKGINVLKASTSRPALSGSGSTRRASTTGPLTPN
jgi:hypothetical protein